MNKLKTKIHNKGIQKFPNIFKKIGFSLAEMLIAMLVISIIAAAAAPMMSQMSQMFTGMNKGVLACVANNTTSWYNDTTGETTLPATEADCNTAITNVIYNRGSALHTATWVADYGKTEQQGVARKILKAACDNGGEKACDYFIRTCWKNGSASIPYCDKSDFGDLTNYLHHTLSTDNEGALYIYSQLQGLLPKMMTNLVNEVSYACGNDQTPDYNQNLNNNLACKLIEPWFYIKACNMGINAACIQGYNANYNRGCYQVKLAWADAPSGNYQLSADGDPTSIPTREVYCDMSSIASAAITGCNASPYVPADCTYGYNQSYNRSCDQIVASWSGVTVGETYNITENGALVAPTSFTYDGTCPAVALPNCPYSLGDPPLADGTIFAGEYNGYCYYVDPADEPGYPSADNLYEWGASNYSLYYVCYRTGTESDGATNTQYIINIGLENTYAAQVCDSKTDFGHTDWFLPAKNELNLFFNNKDFIGGFASAYYWASSEYNYTYAHYVSLSTGLMSHRQKYYRQRVRCARKERFQTYVAPDPANCLDAPGNVCSDDTVYAGDYNGYHYYTTAYDEPQGSYPEKYLWGAYGYNLTDAVSTTDGEANTTAILSRDITNTEAAFACQAKNDNLDNGHNDWFLPAYNELKLLSTNKNAIGNFLDNYAIKYWSSTQGTSIWWNYGFYVKINDGSADEAAKTEYNYVRCMRKDPI